MPRSDRTPQQVVARLERFAARRGPDGVARAFRMFGVKGQARLCRFCPVAVYLQRATGVDFIVGAGIQFRGPDGSFTHAHSPGDSGFPGIRAFVARFDYETCYPELEAAHAV